MGRDFDGVNDQVNFGDITAFDGTTAVTVMAWLIEDFGASTGFDRIWGKHGDGGADDGYLINELSTGNTVRVLYRIGGVSENANTTSDVSNTAWTSLGGHWDNTSNELGVLFNGSEEDTEATSGDIVANTFDLNMGQTELQSTTFFNGNGAEVVMWNIKLTNAIMATIHRGVNPFVVFHDNLQCYCPMYGNESPEPNYGLNPAQTGTVTGTTKVTHPPVELIENYL